MKKIISILLVAIMLISISIMPTLAENRKYYPQAEKYQENCPVDWFYHESYYHYSDGATNPDWAYVHFGFDEGMFDDTTIIQPQRGGVLFGDRLIVNDTISSNTPAYGYAVYVAELDTFIPVYDNNVEKILEYCPDFLDVLEEQGYGTQFGDVNNDENVDIIDVTYIQRDLAGFNDILNVITSEFLVDIYKDFKFSRLNSIKVDNRGYMFISDFDRDGEVSILDATEIQLKLARLD